MKTLHLFYIASIISSIAFAQAPNDDCTSAEIINVSNINLNVSFDINSAIINNEIGCSGTTNDYADVWFSFIMPFNGNVYLGSNINWNNFALYDSCGGNEIQCGNNNEFFTNLTSGNNYILRVFRNANTASNTGFQNFSIKAFEEVTNNNCATAETITVTTESSTVNFNIGGAELNNEVGCSGNTEQEYVDIWYEFTMPVNGNLYLESGISWNNFTLYDSCGGNEIQCGNANEFYTNLTSGTNYKLRVFRTRSAADNNFLSFNIKAFEEVTNDDCASAETITVTTETSTVNFNIGGAELNNEVGCSGNTAQEYVDIWYEFTMPTNGDLNINGNINWNNFALYDACEGTEIQCGNLNEQYTNLTMGTIYKLRVFRTSANAIKGFLSFSIYTSDTLSTNTLISEDNIRIFPNPSQDYIKVLIHDNYNLKSLKLYNILGNKIKESNHNEINTKSVTSGLYLLKITTKKGQITKRVIIKN